MHDAAWAAGGATTIEMTGRAAAPAKRKPLYRLAARGGRRLDKARVLEQAV